MLIYVIAAYDNPVGAAGLEMQPGNKTFMTYMAHNFAKIINYRSVRYNMIENDILKLTGSSTVRKNKIQLEQHLSSRERTHSRQHRYMHTYKAN